MVKPIGTGAPPCPQVNSTPDVDPSKEPVGGSPSNPAPDQTPDAVPQRNPGRLLAEDALAENVFAANLRAYQLHASPDGSSGSNATPGTTTGATAKTDAPQIAAPQGSPFGPGKKVLMLGDSHTVMAYGKKMKDLIKGTGSDVTVDAKVGARPKDFPERIAEHIRKEKPDTIVVSLGTNFREGKMTQGQVNIQVERIMKAVRDAGSNAKIIWVGPPRLAEDMKDKGASLDGFDKMMQKAMGSKGQYVSSNPNTTYKGRDGVHYEDAQAEAWAKATFDQIHSQK